MPMKPRPRRDRNAALVFITTWSCCKETRNLKAEQRTQDFTIPVIDVHECVTK